MGKYLNDSKLCSPLPKGWKIEESLRKSGVYRGKRVDIKITSPNGQTFRSKAELEKYIKEKKLNIKIDQFKFSSIVNTNKMEPKSVTEALKSPLQNISMDSARDSPPTPAPDTPRSCTNNEIQNDLHSVTDVGTNTTDKLTLSCSILEGEWITDDSIHTYFDILSKIVLPEDICLINPVVTQLIKGLEDTDFIFEPMQLINKNFIFFPISDCPNVDKIGGSHWSLLLFVRSSQRFLYLDSINTYNLKYAEIVANKVKKYLLKDETTVDITRIESPQQTNSVDCGVFVAIFTDILLQKIFDGSLQDVEEYTYFPDIDRAHVLTKRAHLALFLHTNRMDLNSNTIRSMMFQMPKNTTIKKTSMTNNSSQTEISDTHKIKRVNQCYNEPFTVPRKTKKPQSLIHPQLPLSNKYDMLSEEDLEQEPDGVLKKATHCNLTPKNKSNLNQNFKIKCQAENIKIDMYADSQGRGVPEIIGHLSNHGIYVDALVKPGADIQYIYNQAKNSRHRPIVLLAGTNDTLKGPPKAIYSKIERELKTLSHLNPVCITTIPPRFDIVSNDNIHLDIALANNYLRELVLRMKNVHLIDLDLFQRYHFSQQGLHLNYKGKRKLASLIVNFIKSKTTKGAFQTGETKTKIQQNTNYPTSSSNRSEQKPINIIETHMSQVIRHYREDPEVGFAHSISGDFWHPRHMSAGVAVVFRKLFGRPLPSQCSTRHLAVQESKYGASIYSLITKGRYFGKPKREDYESAFSDLTKDFKSRGLKHLVCSPVGCVRDKVDLAHFIANIVKFQQHTNAAVTIVSYFQQSFRELQNGLSHEEFLQQMRTLLDEREATSQTRVTSDVESHRAGGPPSSIASDEASHLDILPSPENSNHSEKVKIVPGDLTYCEALKQSISGKISSDFLCVNVEDCALDDLIGMPDSFNTTLGNNSFLEQNHHHLHTM